MTRGELDDWLIDAIRDAVYWLGRSAILLPCKCDLSEDPRDHEDECEQGQAMAAWNRLEEEADNA